MKHRKKKQKHKPSKCNRLSKRRSTESMHRTPKPLRKSKSLSLRNKWINFNLNRDLKLRVHLCNKLKK